MIRYLKYLFFYFEWKINTKLSTHEIANLFRSNIELKNDVRVKDKKNHRHFIGELSDEGFKVYRYSSYRYSYVVERPAIIGNFSSRESGSELKTVFRISYTRFAEKLSVLLGILVIYIVIVHYFTPDQDDIWDTFKLALPFALSGIIVINLIIFWYEVLNSISIMQSIIKENL